MSTPRKGTTGVIIQKLLFLLDQGVLQEDLTDLFDRAHEVTTLEELDYELGEFSSEVMRNM
jgi:hypothetical protein